MAQSLTEQTICKYINIKKTSTILKYLQSKTISIFKSQTCCRSYGDETEEKPCGAETGGVHLTVAGWRLGLGMKGKNHFVLYIPSPADRVKVGAIFPT